jgi:NADH-quinone oxidoreductase subunit N
MNLGAFAIVAFLRNHLGSEEIADYAGLARTSPGVAVCFSVILVSLVGIPPLAGFAGKFLIFYSLLSADLIALLVIGGVNTFLSLFYYLRVIRVMTIDPELEGRAHQSLPLASLAGVLVSVLTVPVIILGVWIDPLREAASAAARRLFS